MAMINLTHAEIGLIVVEVSILASLLIVILWLKTSAKASSGRGLPGKGSGYMTGDGGTGDPHPWGNLLEESQTLSSRLNKNLVEKRELTQSLMKRLDEKIQELDRRVNSAGPPEEDVYARAVEMSNAGAALADISRALKLPKGEVQLIYDLQKYCR
jgi:hypothetical protein